ncbi:MAG: cellobiose phosphorylase [Hespellia sp.]|nr:cellobiose phosphorylase [Hespellia sp.]
MAFASVIEDFQPRNNSYLLSKAEREKPVLKSTMVIPKKIISEKESYGKDDVLCYDFGNHFVGYVTMHISTKGSHPDAPAFLKLCFAEHEQELKENSADYRGWISKGWIQEEWIHIDTFPAVVKLPRRYAFRYMQIEVLDTSQKYKVVFDKIECEYVNAVGDQKIEPVQQEDELLCKIDKVSIRTLQNCMQDVFEDGPKRDRRLWIGDLRLQALTNYKTFKNYQLVKRCLYLFAGSTFPDGRVSANIFTDGSVEADDTYFYDYALFFVPILADYYRETKDQKVLQDLYDTAKEQIRFGMERVDQNGIVRDTREDENAYWCFLDWNMDLNKQTGAQGVLIFCLKRMIELAEAKKDQTGAAYYTQELERLTDASKKRLFDEKQGVFVSGAEKQISTMSQAWMILAGVFDIEMNRKILKKIKEMGLPYEMLSPYAMHNYCEALIVCGETAEATALIKNYWGGMILEGADTFWEMYNPKNPDESPYGGKIINSHCHAWSCTPSYLFREYDFTKEAEKK